MAREGQGYPCWRHDMMMMMMMIDPCEFYCFCLFPFFLFLFFHYFFSHFLCGVDFVLDCKGYFDLDEKGFDTICPLSSIIIWKRFNLYFGKGLSSFGLNWICFTGLYGSVYILIIGELINNLYDFWLRVFILVEAFVISGVF